jgi:nitrogen fixation-related uncharacterized protein
MSVVLLYLRPVLLLLCVCGAGAFFLWRTNQRQVDDGKRKKEDDGKRKKDDDATIEDDKRQYKDNDDDMKQIMKDMKRDQRKRRESDKEALAKDMQEQERIKKEELERAQAEENRKKEDRCKEMRRKVARELLETEKSYVEKLNTLVDVFEQPMKHSLTVTADQRNHIFSNVESLRNFNVMLLQDLENIVANWSDNSELGGVFLRVADFFKLYITYINNYTHSIETVNTCKQNTQFCTLLEACERNPRCSGLDLPSLLIMPVQRIPRYILLLTEIYKNTLPSHVDYAKLGQALTKVKDVAVNINEAKRNAESHLRIYDISKHLDNMPEPLLRPSRRLILEGELKQKPKAASLSEAWESMSYILFNDILIQAKKKGKRFVVKSVSPLSSLQVARYDNKNEFGLFLNNVFLLITGATNEETTKWLDAITDAQKAESVHHKISV